MSTTIHNYIVRISTPEGTGGGFLFSPSSDSSEVYVTTARHCLTDANDVPLEIEQIVIEFLVDGEWQGHTLTDRDTILLGRNYKTEDIGLLMIPLSIIPKSIDLQKAPLLCDRPTDSICLEITGIPKAVLNQCKRTLYQLKILSDRDYVNEIQIEVADPITGQYNSDNLLEGYSGSPVLLKTETTDYVCGIFLSYEDTTKRVLAIDLLLANTLLEKNEYPRLLLPNIETNQDILNAIKRLDANSKRVLTRIRDKVGTINLERRELTDDLVQKILDSKFTIVSGKPGVGKSAIVKKALHLLGENCSIIALQGEQLDKNSLTEIFRQSPFDFLPELECVLSSNYYTSYKILLIDSIEKLLETKNADTILDFFALVAERQDIKIIVTCRSYAVESLKIRFFRKFPQFGDFEIPVLNHEELSEIKTTYPKLESLLAKKSLLKVLEVPFNLDLAANLAEGKLMMDVDSEIAFRKVMWNYVIEDENSESDASIRRLRGEVFMEIAIKRSAGMRTYAFIDVPHEDVIEKLHHDGIIDKEPIAGKSYAASHDIFEDWALERHIEENFQRYAIAEGRYDNFYTSLSVSPAIRRVFRIWFSEKMQIVNKQANELLQSTLGEIEVENHWKDEILVSIMQSQYSKTFLEENKLFLFQDNFRYFERSLFVLKVACQKLDLRYLNLYTEKEKTKFYHNINLVPFGDGWRNMISFVNENISSLNSQFPSIIKMILEWEKGIDDNYLPEETKQVAVILLAYFKSFETKDEDDNHYSECDSYLEECIRLLFRLSKILKAEVKELISKAHTAEIANNNYRLKNLYGTIIKFVMSGDESKIICILFPQLVIEILEKKWFYYPPCEEEIKKRQEEHPYAYTGHRENKENSFGINRNSDFRYFPASPYQTPILNLFTKDPFATLDFIVKFLNHCTKAYLKSNYDTDNEYLIAPTSRTSFKLHFEDGTIATQHASATLWIMYRGTYIAVPDLIKSVLMALEQFLLTLADVRKKIVGKDGDERYLVVWDYAFEKLLKKSNNVMGSAVLISVAMAHPEQGAEKILPLLRIKEIYSWDILRFVRESSALSPLGTMKNARQHQIELSNFHKLDHRKNLIRDFVLNLGRGGLAPEIHKILDALYIDQNGNDEWKVIVTKMDIRKYVPTKKVSEGYILEAVVDESLKPLVEEQKKDAEESAIVSSASSWSFNKFQNKPVEDDSYEKWKDIFRIIKGSEDNTKINNLEKQPGLIAGIGIRDYLSSLDTIEKEWCIEKICAIIEHDLSWETKRLDLKGFVHTPMETEMAYSVLPELMHLSEGEIKIQLRKYIFRTLIFKRGNLEKKTLYNFLYSYLWKKDPEFMIDCIAGIYEYSTFSSVLHRTGHIELPSEVSTVKEENLWFFAKAFNFFTRKKKPIVTEADLEKESFHRQILEVRTRYQELITSIGTGINKPIFDTVNFDEKNIDMVFEIHKLIPYDTKNTMLQDFSVSLLNYILENLNKKDLGSSSDYQRFDHESLQDFGGFATKYLLNQELTVAHRFFDALTANIFKTGKAGRIGRNIHEFVSQRLEDLHLAFLADDSKSRNYWSLLEKFIKKSTSEKTFMFDKQLLFNHYMFDSFEFNWTPLIGKRQLFTDFIAAGTDLNHTIKFISGVGFTEMMPEAVELIASLIKTKWIEPNHSFYFDQLIIQAYHDSVYRKRLQSNAKLREAFIKILDAMINKNASSSAYIIREDFIFSKSVH